MSEERVERRLAAILAADVAGYSRLMGDDEEGTLAALKAIRRQLVDPKIKEHRGRVVKTTGDGALVEALQHAYEARLAAVVDGDDVSLTRTSRDVEDVERRWLEHRELRRLARPVIEDTAYFLG